MFYFTDSYRFECKNKKEEIIWRNELLSRIFKRFWRKNQPKCVFEVRDVRSSTKFAIQVLHEAIARRRSSCMSTREKKTKLYVYITLLLLCSCGSFASIRMKAKAVWCTERRKQNYKKKKKELDYFSNDFWISKEPNWQQNTAKM